VGLEPVVLVPAVPVPVVFVPAALVSVVLVLVALELEAPVPAGPVPALFVGTVDEALRVLATGRIGFVLTPLIISVSAISDNRVIDRKKENLISQRKK
jgi:hypothetical protein